MVEALLVLWDDEEKPATPPGCSVILASGLAGMRPVTLRSHGWPVGSSPRAGRPAALFPSSRARERIDRA